VGRPHGPDSDDHRPVTRRAQEEITVRSTPAVLRGLATALLALLVLAVLPAQAQALDATTWVQRNLVGIG
jgi:hypothetical protein